MVNSFIIWYIVDSRTGGVLVFLWLFSFVEFAFFFKYPQVIPGVMICIVTQVRSLGFPSHLLPFLPPPRKMKPSRTMLAAT